MKTKLVLLLLTVAAPLQCVWADSYDYLGEYDEQQIYPSYDDARRRMVYKLKDPPNSRLEDEYYESEILRQEAKRAHIKTQLDIERLQYEQAKTYYENYKKDYEEEQKRNRILTTNQTINTLGNIANQIRLIQDLFD